MSDTLYIVMPAYNEEENIKTTLDAWYPIIEKYNVDGSSRLVVVNDGSKDNTYQMMLEYAETHPLFTPLTKPNGGHGPTVIYAYDYAVKQGADWIFQTDSDGQTDPNEFDAFWNDRNDYDALFGNRTERGDGQSRALVEKVVCLLVRYFFGVKVPDANAPFRLMRAEKVKQYLTKLKPDYNLPNIMMTTYFVYYKNRVDFRPITFKPREKGTNSINVKKIVKIGQAALKDFRELKKTL
ncbi:MAG: glycosyltransferase family 2 protein [Clostridia bacterium]|nr:glycosyltransferase family 2 protein [Clostridia bacterium]